MVTDKERKIVARIQESAQMMAETEGKTVVR